MTKSDSQSFSFFVTVISNRLFYILFVLFRGVKHLCTKQLEGRKEESEKEKRRQQQHVCEGERERERERERE